MGERLYNTVNCIYFLQLTHVFTHKDCGSNSLPLSTALHHVDKLYGQQTL